MASKLLNCEYPPLRVLLLLLVLLPRCHCSCCRLPTHLSRAAEAMFPSVRTCTAATWYWCPSKVCRHSAVRGSHTFTVVSREPEPCKAARTEHVFKPCTATHRIYNVLCRRQHTLTAVYRRPEDAKLHARRTMHLARASASELAAVLLQAELVMALCDVRQSACSLPVQLRADLKPCSWW